MMFIPSMPPPAGEKGFVSLRDHFAAAALTGLLSNVQRYQNEPLAKQAFEIAAFMLRERERTSHDAGCRGRESGCGTGDTQEPAAWAVTMGDGSVYEAFAAHQRDEAVELAKSCLFGKGGPLPLAPLYRHPPRQECPYVTGETTRYCTLTPFTLTDAERQAIKEAADAYEQNNGDPDCERIANRLYGLLSRLQIQSAGYTAGISLGGKAK